VIVMPTTTPQLKVDAVRSLGGEVVLHGDSYSDAYNHALTLEKKQGLTFVHPFDDPDVIAGPGHRLPWRCCASTRARWTPCLWPLAAAA
jgi:threonine dehydratase